MSNVSQYNVAAGSNTAAPPDGAPENIPPSKVNDIMREMMAALARWYSDSDGTLTSGGAGNSYVLTTNSTHLALVDIPVTTFLVDRANTAAATLNVDGLGAKSLRAHGAALTSGALVADTVISVAYNATDDAFDIVNALVPAAIPDSSLSSNVPLLNAQNVFTNNVQTILSPNPIVQFVEDDASVDNGRWRIGANSEILTFTTVNDAVSASNAFLTVNRTGVTVDSINFAATDVQFNGGALPLTMGGTGGGSASAARTSLGLEIGADVQGYTATLDDISTIGLPGAADEFIVSDGAGSWRREAAGVARASMAAAANTLSGVDFTSLTTVEGNALVAGDDFLVMDDTTAKRIQYSDAGVPPSTISGTTDTLATADMNRFLHYTNGSAIAVTLNSGVGKAGNFIIIKQGGAGQVTVSGTATFEAAIGLKTRAQNSVITLYCQAANTWAVYGDTAA